MNERNVNELPGIRWWMKQRSANYLRGGIFILVMVGIMSTVLFTAGLQDGNLKDMLFLFVFLLFFLLFAIYQFVLWGKSLKWDITEYWFGTVTDMYRYRKTRKSKKTHRIVADVNGKTMEGVCLPTTYNRARIGDRVILFTLDGDKVFCVHPDR